MKPKVEIEVCCDGWEEAKAADEAQVDRIELCCGIGAGGLTPSRGLIELVHEKLEVDCHVLIRPRSGDFLYATEEIEIMKREVLFCKETGVEGVVLGFLTADGAIDISLTQEFVDLARPMKVCFHRAFDMSIDPLKALEELKQIGVDYILTSGQAATAPQGVDLLRELVQQQGDHLKIMPGAGVRAHNLESLMRQTGASSFHMSARIHKDSPMKYRKSSVSMGAQSHDVEYQIQSHDVEVLKQAVKVIGDI